MRRLLEQYIQSTYPLIFGKIEERVTSKTAIERRRLFTDLVESFLDKMTGLLRKEAFINIYFESYAPEELIGLKSDVSSEQLKEALIQSLASSEDGGLVYGDAAYLKIANNISDEHGDKMLTFIAESFENLFTLTGRFRHGDEFILFHLGPQDAIHIACEKSLQRMEAETVDGLPIRADFGVASHKTTLEVYLKLLELGWKPKKDKTPVQVFFDIAIKIAETRAKVTKVHQRAKLLLGFYRYARSGENPDFGMIEYAALQSDLTRGNHLLPDDSWLTIDDIDEFLLPKALELLARDPKDLFDEIVTKAAESIYVI